jgi:hypothetical protein
LNRQGAGAAHDTECSSRVLQAHDSTGQAGILEKCIVAEALIEMSWDPHYPAELTLLPKSESQPTCSQFQHWIDFENLELHVTRSIWHQVVGKCKTEASAKPVPMDSYMAEDLLRWHSQST